MYKSYVIAALSPLLLYIFHAVSNAISAQDVLVHTSTSSLSISAVKTISGSEGYLTHIREALYSESIPFKEKRHLS